MRSLPGPALGAAEILLNRYLAADPRALRGCAALAGHSLAVCFTDLSLAVVFVAEASGMQLRALDDDIAIDVRLSGASPVFGRILFSGGREGVTGGGVRINGDIGIAQRFADVFAAVDFDITDLIDARLGPVPAYFAGRGLKNLRKFAARASRELPEQIAEYLREESYDAIGHWEHEQLAGQVETLRDDVDRLSARVRRLKSAARW